MPDNDGGIDPEESKPPITRRGSVFRGVWYSGMEPAESKPPSTSEVIGSTFAVGVVGAILGIVIGGLVGYAVVPVDKHPAYPVFLLFDMFGSLFRAITTLIGAGIGGILGAIAGSMIGATLRQNP